MVLEERTSSLPIKSGLHLIRYVAPLKANVAPQVFLRPSLGSEASLRVVPVPGCSDTLLTPGGYVVVAADHPATLQITVRSAISGGPLEAKLELRPLEDFFEAPARPIESDGRGLPVAKAPDVSKANAPALEILAHVARRGDVRQKIGGWICGPDAPAPIEGIQLQGDHSKSKELELRVLRSGDRSWTPWQPADQFAGSRGLARPLIGIGVRLVDKAGAGITLTGEALFLGSSVVRKSGREVEFRSHAGLDPLVGFRLDLQKANTGGLATLDAVLPVTGLQNHSSRVRVFRSSTDRVAVA